MKTRIIHAMAALGTVATLASGPAAAQGNVYCNGQVQAASFYSTTSSTPTRSTVSYYVILQSMVGEPLSYSLAFNDQRVVSRPNGTVPLRLGPWGTSQPVFLGVAVLANPSGTGGLNVPTDLAANTRVTCRAVRG